MSLRACREVPHERSVHPARLRLGKGAPFRVAQGCSKDASEAWTRRFLWPQIQTPGGPLSISASQTVCMTHAITTSEIFPPCYASRRERVRHAHPMTSQQKIAGVDPLLGLEVRAIMSCVTLRRLRR